MCRGCRGLKVMQSLISSTCLFFLPLLRSLQEVAILIKSLIQTLLSLKVLVFFILGFQYNIKILFLRSLLACSFVTVGIFIMQPFFHLSCFFFLNCSLLVRLCGPSCRLFFSSSAVFPVFMFSCCLTAAAPLHCL